MATNKSSEASRNGVGFGRAAAMVAACGLILGVSGTSSSAPPIAGLQLSSGNLQDSSGVAVPASAALSFRPPVTIMTAGVTGAGVVPGLGGLPGLPGSPGSPGLPGSPGFSGGLASGSMPGSNLFVQPGPASARGSLADVVPFAYQGLGHPYVWGGTSFASGWDCSGFVQWAFAQAGFQLPRVSQWVPLQPTQNPSPGDLVTQRPDGPNHWGHVGIYVGDGMMISALNPDQGTIKHSIGPAGTSWFFTLPGTVRNGPDPSDAPGSGLSATVPGLSFPSVSGPSGGSSGGGSVNASSDQRNDGPSKSHKGSDSKRDPNTFKNDSFSVPGTARPTPSPTDKPKSHDPSRPSDQGNVNKPSTSRPDNPKQSHDKTPNKNPGTGTNTGTNPGGTGTNPGTNPGGTGTNTGTNPGGTGTTNPKPNPKPGTGTTNPKPTPGTDTGTVTPPATNEPAPAPPVDKTPQPAPKPPVDPTPPSEPTPTVEQPPTAPVTEQPATPAPPTTPATPAVAISDELKALLVRGTEALAAGGPGALGTVVTVPMAGDLVYYPSDGTTPARVGVYLADGTVLLNGAAEPSPVEAGVTYYRVS